MERSNDLNSPFVTNENKNDSSQSNTTLQNSSNHSIQGTVTATGTSENNGNVIILIDEEKYDTVDLVVFQVTLKKIPARILGIKFIPGTNKWDIWSKIKFALNCILILVDIALDIYSFVSVFDQASNNSNTGNECSSSTNEKQSIQLLYSYISLFRQVFLCFRQYLFHMLNYEWPFMRWTVQNVPWMHNDTIGLPVLRYVSKSGQLSWFSPFCCEFWYIRSGFAATLNLIITILYIGGFVYAVQSQNQAYDSDYDTCDAYDSIKSCYQLYNFVIVLSTISYNLMVLRFAGIIK